MSALSSASTTNTSTSTKRDKDGEAKQSTPSPPPADKKENPPTRRGIIVDVMVDSADKFVEFMGKTTKAEEYFRYPGEDGKIMHLSMNIGGVAMYVEEIGNSMDHGGISEPHVRLHLNLDDPMAMAAKLLEHGAKEITKCAKQFWGATFGVYKDPFGQIWSVSSSSTGTIEDVPKELERKVIPFVSVRNCDAYMTFLSDVFGAKVATPTAKDPNGKIMCAEMTLNGGLIMLGDHCGHDADRTDSCVTISHEVGKDEAIPLAQSFKALGGEIVDMPSMQFWGQVWGRAKDSFGNTWGLCEVQAGPVSNEEMAVHMEIGAKHDWKYTWAVEDVPTMHCYGEVTTCSTAHTALSKEMKTMLPRAFSGAMKAGLVMAGPPGSVYYTWDSSPEGTTKFTCGPFVAGGAAAEALAKDPDGEDKDSGVRPAGGCKCACTVHVGPYDKLMDGYKATFEWIAANGYDSRMPVFEVYENDPQNTAPEKLRTKIYIPVVPKEKKEEANPPKV